MQLDDGSNAYIDDALDSAAAVWAELAGRDGQLNDRLLEVAWQHIVGSLYMSLLEGFSKIKSFSTEGRALVSMDLQSFASGITNNLVERVERAERKSNAAAPPPPPPPPLPPASTNPFGDDDEGEDANNLALTDTSQTPLDSDSDDDFIIREPPKVTPPRGRHWVDAYVKAWYFDEGDLIKWISQNRAR